MFCRGFRESLRLGCVSTWIRKTSDSSVECVRACLHKLPAGWCKVTVVRNGAVHNGQVLSRVVM